MRRFSLFAMFVALTTLSAASAGVAADDLAAMPTKLTLHIGQDAAGSPTDDWLHAVRHYHDTAAIRELALELRPFNGDETAWLNLIASRLRQWSATTPALQEPFGSITPPSMVVVLLGNLGGSDAFVATDSAIAFDLRRLQEVYGSADSEMNRDRIDRFFAHEYTHIVHRVWRKERGLVLQSALESALWDCLKEGVGNYRSLSARWRNPGGSLSQHAETTLERLSPVFVSRLAALETATAEEVPALLDGMSSGPFADKWGALPVALWLAAEMSQDGAALGKWVERGPWGVIEIAKRHLPDALALQLPDNPQ